MDVADIPGLGGVATRALPLTPRLGNPVQRIAEGRGVILNAVGLQKPGVDAFLEHDLAWLKSKTRVLANVAGSTIEDYAQICARLDGLVDFVELNISCPNVKCGGMAFGIRPETIGEVTRAAKKSLPNTPLIVKLSPNVESIARKAQAAEKGGADGIAPVNPFTGMVSDIERRKPLLANTTGGVSGAGIKPVAVRMVYEASHAVHIPVIGMGGICTAEDAVEFLMAGASAVQGGTHNFTDTLACPKIVAGPHDWGGRHRVSPVSQPHGAIQ